VSLRILFLPIVFWALAVAAVRLVVVPGEGCGDIDSEQARNSALAAGRWIIAGQHVDGSYTYDYDYELGGPTGEYNIVRHAGVTMSLYQVAGRLGSDEAFVSADRGLEWMLQRLKAPDGAYSSDAQEAEWLALSDDEDGKLGAAALMTIALAERRLLTGDEQHDDVMRALGRFMVALQRPDGGFHIKWLFLSGRPETGTTSLYYPGEALWALALLHEALPDEGWDEAAWAAADFISLQRDDVENVKFPPLNDHWAAYGLAEMVEWGLADHHVDYARDLAGRFSFLLRVESQKSEDGLIGFIRGGPRRAAAVGTWVEGTAALWRLAAHDERLGDIKEKIAERAACGAEVLRSRQATDSAGPLEAGAWFVSHITRMDDQQHAISGLVYTADILEGRGAREPDREATRLR
jgi:hypothetical protein